MWVSVGLRKGGGVGGEGMVSWAKDNFNILAKVHPHQKIISYYFYHPPPTVIWYNIVQGWKHICGLNGWFRWFYL